MRRRLIGIGLVAALVSLGGPTHADECTIDGLQSSLFGHVGQLDSVQLGQSDWIGFSTGATAQIRLQPLTGDADLFVYRVTGSSPCPSWSSNEGDMLPDTVTVGPGNYNIEVRYYASPVGDVWYHLYVLD